MKDKQMDLGCEIVPVELGPRSYPIYVGADILRHLGKVFAQRFPGKRAIIITDENVAPLYAAKAQQTLDAADIRNSLCTVGPGEESKTLTVLEKAYDALFDAQAERSDIVVALGGGVIGDLAGFVAATFKRGLNFIQVPTSLLAMVDSSIGGKTGINHPRGKNMIGAFHQPRLVLADVATLQTLPKRELGCGLAETVKHAIIRDAKFFDFLEANAAAIMQLDQRLITQLVVHNCKIKSAVVAADERESGLRGILNLGHTIGHTFETVLPGHPYHHGEAVSLGTVAALRLAQHRGLMDEPAVQRCIRLLEAFNLPTKLAADVPIDDLYTAMLQDKKVKAGKIVFVLPTQIGDCKFVDDLTVDEIKNAIAELR
ncbi:MAG: 3-dehydroquinate synthase [Sedimentisphaerales bacterium]|nr:3-dehydroquinate synthase [Sedimentisphaerales bacterium]